MDGNRNRDEKNGDRHFMAFAKESYITEINPIFLFNRLRERLALLSLLLIALSEKTH